jgi:hypothetical protein
MAYIAKHLDLEFHAIDCFVLCKEEQYRKTLDATGLPYNLHVGTTSSVTQGAPSGMVEVPWKDPVSFLLIDAAHNEPWFSADCRKWLPLIESGGIVAFDDWAEPNPVGNAHWAIAHFGEMYTKDWEDLGWIGNRLRIKRKV